MKSIYLVESRWVTHKFVVASPVVALQAVALPVVVQHNFAGLWSGMKTEVFDKQTLQPVGVLLVEALRLGFGQNKVQLEQVVEGQLPFELQLWRAFVDR